MASKNLDERRIHALHAAVIDAGLAGHRNDFLRGIDASVVAGLPVSAALSAQILTDLFELNITLRDGSVPLVRWLANAHGVAGSKPVAALLEEALAHLGHPVPARSVTSVKTEEPKATAADRLDVVILAALQDELEAVLALGEKGRDGWEEKRDLQGFRYFHRRFSREGGGDLAVAAAWIGEMGSLAAAARGQQLVEELNPGCLAMCGICAGWRKKVALGDIVVADRLYSYDHGKLVVGADGKETLFHDLETFSLDRTWKMDAAFLARELPLGDLAAERPPSLAAQRAWLLHALQAHETESAPAPANQPDRKIRCPDWALVVTKLRDEGLISREPGKLALTDQGRGVVSEDRLIHPDGPPLEPRLQVHVGAMAMGRTVREDPQLFERLSLLVRSTLAVDMEGMAVAEVAGRLKRQAIVVKAVSDHADHDKDDRYRAFACKASATFLLAFLRKHLDGERA